MARTVTDLQLFLAQRGLFQRVAKKLGVDPSYVSRVVNGHRINHTIMKAVEQDLKKARAVAGQIQPKPSRKKK
jgi:hypothetical protein